MAFSSVPLKNKWDTIRLPTDRVVREECFKWDANMLNFSLVVGLESLEKKLNAIFSSKEAAVYNLQVRHHQLSFLLRVIHGHETHVLHYDLNGRPVILPVREAIIQTLQNKGYFHDISGGERQSAPISSGRFFDTPSAFFRPLPHNALQQAKQRLDEAQLRLLEATSQKKTLFGVMKRVLSLGSKFTASV